MLHLITSALITLAGLAIFVLLWRSRKSQVARMGDGWTWMIVGSALFLFGQIVGLLFFARVLNEVVSSAFRATSITLGSAAIVLALLLFAIGLYRWLTAAQALSAESDTVKQSNDNLRARLITDETLLSMMPAVFYRATIFRSGRPPRIEFQNTKIEELLGYRVEEYEANPGLFASLIHEEDRSGNPSDLSSFLYGQEIVAQNRFRTKDGDYKWLRRHLKTYPVENDDEIAMNCYGALFDITDLKEAEARLTNFLEGASDPVIAADASSNIVLVNAQAERLFGYSKSELLGQSIDMLLPEESSGAFIKSMFPQFMQLKVSQRIDTGQEIFGKRKDGNRFPVEASVCPMDNGNQKALAFAIRDVSSHRKIELQLRRARERGLTPPA